MKITFLGGAGEVTGSRHLLESGGFRALLDCGLFQGHRSEAIGKNRALPADLAHLDAVILSHAHIDHSGGLPLLAKNGWQGAIHCTEATADLCGIMLMDSAHLQEEDARFFNKIHQKDGQRIEPLYDEEHAKACLDLFRGHAYRSSFPLFDDISARFLNAGHVLGSAMIELSYKGAKGPRRLLFTGDLGRRDSILMTPPDRVENVDYLVIESTYGGRRHEDASSARAKLKEVVLRAVEEKGKVLIPSFALERTQEIVYVLNGLRRAGEIPEIPIYVDSPMAVNITEIFRRHMDCYCLSAELQADAARNGDPFGFRSIRYVRTASESKTLNDRPGPLVIISASGMCEGGRILHHLRNNIGNDNTTILIAGYQAAGTLGGRLLQGAQKIKIFGLEHSVWARIEQLQSLSAHADQEDLVVFVRSLSPRPRKIFLVHGEARERDALARRLKIEGIERLELPEQGQAFELD